MTAQMHRRTRNPGTIDARIMPYGFYSVAGLMSWWDFSTLSLANGAFITDVLDKSPNGYNLSQSTEANKPTFEAAAKNGLGAAVWDTVPNDRLIISNGAGGVPLGTTHTAFVVARTGPANATQIMLAQGGSDYLGYFHSGGVNVYENHNAVNGAVAHGTSLATWYIMVFTRNAGAWSFYLNGGSATNGTCGNTTFTPVRLGDDTTGTAHLRGWKIGEMALFNTVLDATDIENLRSMLNRKWAIY